MDVNGGLDLTSLVVGLVLPMMLIPVINVVIGILHDWHL